MKDENKLLVKYSNLFHKQLKALPLDIKIAFRETRELFLYNSKHPVLRDHDLKKKFAGFKSIDVTGDYRAVYRISLAGTKKVINFHMIGTHKELYGK